MEQYIELVCVPLMTTAVYWIIAVLKYALKGNKVFPRLIPLLALVLGVICGIVIYYIVPEMIMAENILIAIMMGATSGMTAIGSNQMIKQISSGKKKGLLEDINEIVPEKATEDNDIDIGVSDKGDKDSESCNNNECCVESLKGIIQEEVKTQIIIKEQQATEQKEHVKAVADDIKNLIISQMSEEIKND